MNPITFQAVCATREGRKFLFELMQHCGDTDGSVVEGDPYGTHFNEGMRAIAVYLHGMFRTNHFTRLCYLDMVREYLVDPSGETGDKDEDNANQVE